MIRSSKLGSDWNASDLLIFKIEQKHQKAPELFGRELSSIDHLDPNLLLPIERTNVPDMKKETYRFLVNLRLAYYGDIGLQGALKEFTAMVLETMEYDEFPTILRRNYTIPFTNNGRCSLSTPDICLFHYTSAMILLVARIGLSSVDLDAQVIADAIAAFETNNFGRQMQGLPRLDPMIIPCITMSGLHPCFFKVAVTQQLSDAVARGISPETPTIVTRCIPPWWHECYFAGMETPEYRQTALQYFDAFRLFAKDCWSETIAGFPEAVAIPFAFQADEDTHTDDLPYR